MTTVHDDISVSYGNTTTPENKTNSPVFEDYIKPYHRIAAAISFTLFVLIISLNSIVIYTLLFKTKKKSRLFFFILHLAIADVLVGFISVLAQGLNNSFHHVWYAGDIMCKIHWYLNSVVVVASNNLLIGLSIDRFLAVKSPLKVMAIGKKLNKGLVIGSWLISMLLFLFLLYYCRTHLDRFSLTRCAPDFPGFFWKPYIYGMATVVFLLPAVVITLCYSGICIVIWRRWREGLKLSEMNKTQHNGMLREQPQKDCGLLPKAKVKSVKLTLIVCIAFFVCWTPYFAIIMMEMTPARVDRRVFAIMNTLYPLNSAANPLIFIVFNWRLFRPAQPCETSSATMLTTMTQ